MDNSPHKLRHTRSVAYSVDLVRRRRRDSKGTGKASKPVSHIHFINTRNKITNYTHFGSRFRAIQTCSYKFLGVAKIYLDAI